jgi:7-carboxy-7-deazaguanine synthase
VAAAPTERPFGDAAGALRLKITEVFHSIQGEALHSGWPTVFVRLTGCPLRCRYCDTAYAFGGGEWWTCGEIIDRVASFGARHVCVTGGEPLAQSRCLALLEMLCDAGYEVCLETGGAHDIGPVDPRVSRIVDVKTPGSGESARNRLENLALLTSRDALKIVVTSRDDYEWARTFVQMHDAPCPVFLSPSFTELSAADLADWILADRLPVRLQVQLHKALWGDTPGR